MNLQVNLLKKTEQRYQGIVSMKVMVLGSIGVLTGITVLVLMLAGISKVTLKTNLDRARREWERLDPQAALVRQAEAAATSNRTTLAGLEGWSQGSRTATATLLRAVQREIPERMQLSHMFAGIEKNGDQAYRVLRFSGRTQGEMIAVDAKRRLTARPEIRTFCGEVKLVSSQRDTGENWSFALEGRTPAGGVQ
jgi:hypothetical protein